MFVHDFVRVGLPLEQAVTGLTVVLDNSFPRLAARAWEVDVSHWEAAGLRRSDLSIQSPLHVATGEIRVRAHGVVVPFSWPAPAARLVPSVDADLELASCGPLVCDLQLLGRYRLESAVPRTANEVSLAHRATVTAMRRLLEATAGAIETRATQSGLGTVTPSSAPTGS